LLAAFVAERFNPSFETAEELERFTNLPVLSSVPGIPGGGRRTLRREPQPSAGELSTADQRRLHQDHRLATLSDPQSVAAQQYAILALKIQQWMAETGGKTLMITSGSGAEGKSLTALNLSLALAAAIEGRVLLV